MSSQEKFILFLKNQGITNCNIKDNEIDCYLDEIKNITILNNLNFLVQGNIFYTILINGDIIYVDPKTGDIPSDNILEKSFYDEVKNIIQFSNGNKFVIRDLFEQKSFQTFDYEKNVMYITYIINNKKKRLWIDIETSKILNSNEIEYIAKKNNWFYDEISNLWCKWNQNKYRSWLGLNWDPVNNFPSTIEEENFRKICKEYEFLPIGLRPPKLSRQTIFFKFPEPRLVSEINELDIDGYPIVIK